MTKPLSFWANIQRSTLMPDDFYIDGCFRSRDEAELFRSERTERTAFFVEAEAERGNVSGVSSAYDGVEFLGNERSK